MNTKQLLKHFKTQRAAARAAKVSQPAVSNWIKRERIPELRQLVIEKATGGALRADRGILR